MKLKEIDDNWFYSAPHPLLKPLQIYVKGDMIVLIPLLVLILIFGLLTGIRSGLTVLAIYLAIRALGEMIYWFLQQFGEETYRPPDMGFSNLSNNAIYILYQLMNLLGVVIWTSFIFWLHDVI